MKRLLAFLLALCTCMSISSQELYTRRYTLQDGLINIENYALAISPHNEVWLQSGVKHIGHYDGITFNWKNYEKYGIDSYLAYMEFFDSILVIMDNQKNVIYQSQDSLWKIPEVKIFPYELTADGLLCSWNQARDTILCYDLDKKILYKSPIDAYDFYPDDIDPHSHSISIPLNAQDRYLSLYRKHSGGTVVINKISGKRISSPLNIVQINQNRGYIHTGDWIAYLSLTDTLGCAMEIIDTIPKYYSFFDYQELTQGRSFTLKDTREDGHFAIYDTKDQKFNFLGKVVLPQPIWQKVDHLGNIWMTTHEGLYRVNPYITWFGSDQDGMVQSLHTIVEDGGGNIWFGGYKSGIALYDQEELRQLPISYIDEYNRILPGGTSVDGAPFFLTEFNSPFLIKNGATIKKPIRFSNLREEYKAGYITKRLSNGTFAIGMQLHGIAFIEDFNASPLNARVAGKEQGLKLDNVLTISEDAAGRIWAGRSSQGMALYLPQQDTFYNWMIDPNDTKSFGAISSTIDARNNLWLGTNKGLYFLESPHLFRPTEDLFEKAQKVIFPDNNNYLVACIIESHGYLIAGNNSHIHFIPLDSFYLNMKNPLIYSLNYGEDIPGDGSEQNCLMEDSQGYLWLGTQRGAMRMDIANYPFDNTPVEIELTGVNNGGTPISWEANKITIPKDNRNLTLGIHPKTNFSLQNNIYYNYSLVNNNGDTLLSESYINNPEISLSYIFPGTYSLIIDAYKNGQHKDDLKIEIQVPRTLGESYWFWVGLAAMVIGGIGTFLLFRNKQKRRILQRDLLLSKLKSEKTTLQVQSIVSSFNPHFINNSLHWAQSRYREDELLVKMIGRLSANIQYIFNQTRHGNAYHPLEKEIELVRNYVIIQQIRFEDGFQLILPSDDLLIQHNQFPILIMQLQIHIENAIEHGIRNRQESTFVKLEINETREYLIFEIIDDGCGRPQANKLKSRGTQSGSKMLKELHGIFNIVNQKNITVTYHDNIFYDPQKQIAYGTKVLIEIPKNYNYELVKT